MISYYIMITVLCCTVNKNRAIFVDASSNGYDPGKLLEQIFSGNNTSLRANTGLIKFDDQLDSDFVSFNGPESNPSAAENVKFYEEQAINLNRDNDQSGKVKFEDIGIPNGNNNLVAFEANANKINNGPQKKRRRRKPKKVPVQPGYPYPGEVGNLGPILPGPVQNFLPNPYVQSGFNGQFYRPPRRPRPSAASDALSAVTGALTSIALNDDYQCVARLLCEAAAGGALGSSNLLQSVSGLEPLLTLLSAYNGISSNPLFVFGRAAFLGMSSKGNPASCRYAYPLCPTDTEQLVHYLNNHNGGFFRFFNSPQIGQQNVQQFYNQLTQNYGLYQGNNQDYNVNQQIANGPNNQYYGFLNQGQVPHGIPNPNKEHYGFLQDNNYGAQNPNLYPSGNNYQNYGLTFPYYQNHNGVRYRNDKEINNEDAQERIQNKPTDFISDDEKGSKWLFPGENDEKTGIKYVNHNDLKINDERDDRKGLTLRFPDTASIYNSYVQEEYNRRPKDTYNTEREIYRSPKGISFPDNQVDIASGYNNNYVSNYPSYNNHFYNNNDNVHNDNYYEPGVQTVYVVRGNGDPNKPEIVKLRPGEKLT